MKLTIEERNELVNYRRRRKTSHGLATRAAIVLACAEGLDNKSVAKRLRLSNATVGKWRSRFVESRLDGLLDEPRPGAPRKISDAQVEQVVTLALESKPEGATHWSTRDMAKRLGVSAMAVSRIWRAFGLRPHRVDSFKLSPDPLLIGEVRDVVGLYLNPPDKAVVFCVDEKSRNLRNSTGRCRRWIWPMTLPVAISKAASGLDRWFKDRKHSRVLIESSTESEWVARYLEGLGHEVAVADPYAAMHAERTRRVKTDNRDAEALFEANRTGVYRPAHRRSDAQRRVIEQLGIRDSLVRARTRWISVMRSKLRREGHAVASGSAERFLARVGADGSAAARASEARSLRGAVVRLERADRGLERQEAAWGILRSQRPECQALRRWAAGIAARRGKKVAVVALARRLAGILWAPAAHRKAVCSDPAR